MKLSTKPNLYIFDDKLCADTYIANLQWWGEEPQYYFSFCPMTGYTCNSNCICYEPAELKRIERFGSLSGKYVQWYYYSAYCGNAMFSGMGSE